MTLPRSDHFNGKTFFYPGETGARGFGDLLRWKLTSRAARWPKRVDFAPGALPPSGRDGMAVTWIGHSTFLLQTGQGNFLTDPVFSPRIGPVSWAGPRRVMAPGIPFGALPKIDGVLLSHDHYDHCDLPTLRALARIHRPTVFAPLNYRALLGASGLGAGLVELDWWEGAAGIAGTHVTLVPARHWCRRRIGDTDKRLWGGFILEAGGRRIYFAGDSGYDRGLFRKIGERSGGLDLAMIPIGAYEPRWFMRSAHMNPAEAVAVHADLGARRSLGMHWGTFQLTDEAREAPLAALAAARVQAGVLPADFGVLEPGASLII
jgi:L-ascorbate metabolism protein UlaG (beta-lactamase superfamily)